MSQPPQDPDIVRLSAELDKISAKIPKKLTSALFDGSLFQCRSEKTCDYLQEIRDNLQKLSQLTPGNERYRWFYQHCEAQIMAFVQVAMRNSHTARQAARPETNNKAFASSLQQLHQDLARHHEYERRLEDNLRQAQTSADSAAGQQRVIACQQRLLRCQRAITAIEKQIDAHRG